MPLSDIVIVNITTLARGISQRGFGTALIAAYHTAWPELVRTFSDLDDLVTAGLTVNHPIYRAAQALFASTPHPPDFKVGKRATPFDQAVELKVTDNTEGLVYKVVVYSPGGTATTCSYTVQAGDSVNDIAVALAALINAIADLSAPAPVGDTIAVAADNSGEYFYFEEMPRELEFTDVTPDPGIAADLAAIKLQDPDWYALVIDSNSEAEIKAAAAWIESNERIAGFNTKDAGCKSTTVSDDVMSDLQTAAYARCFCLYSAHHRGYGGARWLGERLPSNPGSSTWAFKTLGGLEVDDLNTTEQGAIESKNGNHYLPVASRNITRWGITPAGEYIDIVRGRDWLAARIQERVYLLLVNNPKVPYTDLGVDMVRSEVRAQLREGITVGYVAADPPFIVTAPLVADISPVDKANRLLPDLNFEAYLAGAIHKVIPITGTLRV